MTDSPDRTGSARSNPENQSFDPRGIIAVCFDLDDTLFDYTQYIRQGLVNAADYIETHTGETVHQELVDLYFEEGVQEGTFDQLIERRELDVAVEALVEAYHDSTGPLDPYEEADTVLSRVAEDYKLGLVTDGRNCNEKLDRLDLDGYFDAIVATPDHGLAKCEHAEAFERVLEMLGVEPTAAVYVGDHPLADIRIPAQLGMRTIRLRRGRYADRDSSISPDAEIGSLAALPGLLGVTVDS